MNLNSLLVKRRNNNPSPGAVAAEFKLLNGDTFVTYDIGCTLYSILDCTHTPRVNIDQLHKLEFQCNGFIH